VCCGKEREVTIDCPVDCTYLIAAHRYEDEHPRALPADTPLLDVEIRRDTVHIHQQLMAAFAFTIAKFCVAHHDATDTDVLAALEAFAETYRTLMTGIITRSCRTACCDANSTVRSRRLSPRSSTLKSSTALRARSQTPTFSTC
jgi:hypothetical protein